jgi:hypothetical protein
MSQEMKNLKPTLEEHVGTLGAGEKHGLIELTGVL